MTQEKIPGQKGLKEVFIRMVDNNRLPHAILIKGIEGGVSLPLSNFLVSYLFCLEKSAGKACGVCSNCKRLASHTHPDVHYIFPVNSRKDLKKEEVHADSFLKEWRSIHEDHSFFSTQDWYRFIEMENKQGLIGEVESRKLREKLALRSYEGGYKVFIIWAADTMNPTFANKLLKNLEEPSERTLFVLVTQHAEHLLPTILSRVQKFEEEPIDELQMVEFLINQYNLSRERASALAFRAEGNLQLAVREALESDDPWLNAFKQWMRLAYQRDMCGLFNWSIEMAAAPRESGRQFIRGALKVLDRCFRMAWVDDNIPMEGEEASFYKNFSPFINPANIEGFMELLQETTFHIERNVNEKMVWYDTSIKAVRLIHLGKKSSSQA